VNTPVKYKTEVFKLLFRGVDIMLLMGVVHLEETVRLLMKIGK
jgi:hypothetical protein